MKTIGKYWFTNLTGVIGIVVVIDEITGEKKAYIGMGGCKRRRYDEEVIKDYGSPIFPIQLQEVITKLTK